MCAFITIGVTEALQNIWNGCCRHSDKLSVLMWIILALL